MYVLKALQEELHGIPSGGGREGFMYTAIGYIRGPVITRGKPSFIDTPHHVPVVTAIMISLLCIYFNFYRLRYIKLVL